jgi:Xaa-Pro aminopeptidase
MSFPIKPFEVPVKSFDINKYRWAVSDAELERRWKLIREEMKKQQIDCLLIQNDNRYRAGMVRYFTDIGCLSNPVTVLFPINDGMTLLSNGGGYSPPQTPVWACRGVKDLIGVPVFPTYNSAVNAPDADAAVELIQKRSYQKIGLVRPNSMLGIFYKRVVEGLKDIEVVDFTEEVDLIKAVKSPEELKFVQKAAITQDYVAEAIPSFLLPGKYEYEIRHQICQLLGDLGSEEQLIMIGSAPQGQRAGHKAHFFQNRRIERGDQVMIMLEPNGPGGYWAELGRTYVLGEIPRELLEVWDDALKAQAYTASLLKPGITAAEIFDKYDVFIKGLGYASETRIYAHGQGYDLMERPGIRPDETMTIQANMNIAIHPTLAKGGGYAFCCDNFLSSETGGNRLHTFKQKIIPVDC